MRISPPIGGRASAGSCETALTSRLSSENDRPPNVRRREEAAPQVLRASVLAIQSTLGSNPRSVTEPEPYGRSAATTRSPAVASVRPAMSSPDRAGQRGRARRQLAEQSGQVRRPGRRS